MIAAARNSAPHFVGVLGRRQGWEARYTGSIRDWPVWDALRRFLRPAWTRRTSQPWESTATPTLAASRYARSWSHLEIECLM